MLRKKKDEKRQQRIGFLDAIRTYLSCEELVSISDLFSSYLRRLTPDTHRLWENFTLSHTSNASLTMKKTSEPPAKTITVYRNGDGYFPGRKIVVNSRLSTFDILLNFLTSLTSGVEAQFGAVRKLYTLQGHKVLHMEQLQHGGGYVAVGNEHFKNLE